MLLLCPCSLHLCSLKTVTRLHWQDTFTSDRPLFITHSFARPELTWRCRTHDHAAPTGYYGLFPQHVTRSVSSSVKKQVATNNHAHAQPESGTRTTERPPLGVDDRQWIVQLHAPTCALHQRFIRQRKARCADRGRRRHAVGNRARLFPVFCAENLGLCAAILATPSEAAAALARRLCAASHSRGRASAGGGGSSGGGGVHRGDGARVLHVACVAACMLQSITTQGASWLVVHPVTVTDMLLQRLSETLVLHAFGACGPGKYFYR